MEDRKAVAAALGTKVKLSCYKCGKIGLIKRDCLDKKDPKQTKVVNVRSTSQRSSPIPATNWDIMVPTVRNSLKMSMPVVIRRIQSKACVVTEHINERYRKWEDS